MSFSGTINFGSTTRHICPPGSVFNKASNSDREVSRKAAIFNGEEDNLEGLPDAAAIVSVFFFVRI
jgi:hypothetical protein